MQSLRLPTAFSPKLSSKSAKLDQSFEVKSKIGITLHVSADIPTDRAPRSEMRKKENDGPLRPSKITLIDDSDNEKDLFDTDFMKSKYNRRSLGNRKGVPVKTSRQTSNKVGKRRPLSTRY